MLIEFSSKLLKYFIIFFSVCFLYLGKFWILLYFSHIKTFYSHQYIDLTHVRKFEMDLYKKHFLKISVLLQAADVNNKFPFAY